MDEPRTYRTGPRYTGTRSTYWLHVAPTLSPRSVDEPRTYRTGPRYTGTRSTYWLHVAPTLSPRSVDEPRTYRTGPRYTRHSLDVLASRCANPFPTFCGRTADLQ